MWLLITFQLPNVLFNKMLMYELFVCNALRVIWSFINVIMLLNYSLKLIHFVCLICFCVSTPFKMQNEFHCLLRKMILLIQVTCNKGWQYCSGKEKAGWSICPPWWCCYFFFWKLVWSVLRIYLPALSS